LISQQTISSVEMPIADNSAAMFSALGTTRICVARTTPPGQFSNH